MKISAYDVANCLKSISMWENRICKCSPFACNCPSNGFIIYNNPVSNKPHAKSCHSVSVTLTTIMGCALSIK